ncbi:MAG: transporter [Proteobacteria bacterium]|nr:MAG: transporter [Pseudomonadota bacterium]
MSKTLGSIFTLVLPLATLGVTDLSFAEPVDKSSYTLFNPTPVEHLREMSTDRPDATEGATTVDAGHYQIEMDLYNTSIDEMKSEDIKTRETAIGSFNLRMGLTQSTELNIIFDPHLEQKVETAGESDTNTGIGDTTIRYKINFMGNEGGPISLGLIPFVKIPTADDDLGNDEYEGGLVIPIGLELPNGFELGMMAQFNYLKNEANKKYHTQLDTSMVLGHDIAGDLGGYIELFSASSTEEDAAWEATANIGFTYEPTHRHLVFTSFEVG